MKREELLITREDAIAADSPTGGPIEPHTIGDMWRAKGEDAKYKRMLASAWLIVHYESLRDGSWPEVRPEEIPSHGGAFHHGPQEIPCIFAAEISARIKACGFDGVLLVAHYQYGEPPGDARRINRALQYCGGWVRKRRSYEDWYSRHYKARGVKIDG